MVNSCTSTGVTIEERLHAVEQTMLKLTEQMQTLTQGISQFRDPLPKGNLGEAIDQKQSHVIQAKPKGEPNENLERKIGALAGRVETLEWVMKFVVNEIQHVNPAIGKAPNHETPREASGLIDKIEWGKEEQGPSLPIPKASSYDKPNQQTPRRHFTQLKVPLTQVFKELREAKLTACKVPKEGYKPKKYDPNAQCEYHMG